MLLRYADDTFTKDYISTIGVDFKIRTIDTDGKIFKLQIWDVSSGRDRFRSITSSYYRGSHGILIVYDVTDRESFEDIRQWMFEIDRYANENVSRVIIGNKIDFEHQREVSFEEANAFCEELGIPYIETSAKDSTNIDAAFDKLRDYIYQKCQTSAPQERRIKTDSNKRYCIIL